MVIWVLTLKKFKILNSSSLITNGNCSLLFLGGLQGSVASSLTELETPQPPNRCIKFFLPFHYFVETLFIYSTKKNCVSSQKIVSINVFKFLEATNEK